MFDRLDEYDERAYMHSNGEEPAEADAARAEGKEGGSSSKEGSDASHEEAPGPECVVYVRGFQGAIADEGAIKQSLKECFGDNGEVARIQLPSSRETGALKGFGFVHFRDASSAAAVLKLGKAGKFSLLGQQLQIRALQPSQSSRRADNAGAEAAAAAAAPAEQRKEQRKDKRLPGSIVIASACMLCRIEGQTCDICREYPTHLLSRHQVAPNPFAPTPPPPAAAHDRRRAPPHATQGSYHNPHSSVAQQPSYNPMYPSTRPYDDDDDDDDNEPMV
jgi:RNA recognition motif-containing protein